MEKISKIILVSLLVILAATGTTNVLAQEETTIVSQEEIVAADEDITAQDLEIAEPKLLPDSPFYFVKNFWRETITFFTLNKVRKAELRLRFANERLIEAKKLAEKTGQDEIFQKTLEKYQQEMEKIKNRVKNFKEKAQDNPKIDSFLDKLIDRTMKHQRLMDRLEKQLSDKPEILEQIRNTKGQVLEHFGEVIGLLEEKDKIPERLEKNLERIEGSKYKNFKNLEVLLELENKVPEQAKEAIRRAQTNSLKRLHEDLEQMSAEDKEKFSDYLEEVSGNQPTHLIILERLKTRKLSPTLEGKIEQNRERAQEKVQNLERDRLQLQEKLQQETPPRQEGTRERACITLWNPVCGVDGKTYSNGCFAKLAGIEIVAKGQCKEVAPEMESKSRR